jgi:uncharacterized OsmC-like protein
MATVHADYQDRQRIVFTARGRSQTNVRELVDDGPVGYSSTELLLIALGNCTLGALLNQQLLQDVEVLRAEATLEAEMLRNPTRVARIQVDIDLQVADEAILEHRADLEALACTCPLCNTLGNVEIVSQLRLTVGESVPAS